MIKKNTKKGWIEVVEAFFAILLIAGVALAVILQHQAQTSTRSTSDTVINAEKGMLSEIEANDSLRAEVVAASPLPVEPPDFSTVAPKTSALIANETPGSFQCTAKICDLSDLCTVSGTDESIYASSVIISASLDSYSPRLLKIFCWAK